MVLVSRDAYVIPDFGLWYSIPVLIRREKDTTRGSLK